MSLPLSEKTPISGELDFLWGAGGLKGRSVEPNLLLWGCSLEEPKGLRAGDCPGEPETMRIARCSNVERLFVAETPGRSETESFEM